MRKERKLFNILHTKQCSNLSAYKFKLTLLSNASCYEPYFDNMTLPVARAPTPIRRGVIIWSVGQPGVLAVRPPAFMISGSDWKLSAGEGQHVSGGPGARQPPARGRAQRVMGLMPRDGTGLGSVGCSPDKPMLESVDQLVARILERSVHCPGAELARGQGPAPTVMGQGHCLFAAFGQPIMIQVQLEVRSESGSRCLCRCPNGQGTA